MRRCAIPLSRTRACAIFFTSLRSSQREPKVIEHDVVLYGNDSAALTRCVVPLIAAGLQDGGAAIIVATAAHERAFRSALSSLVDVPDHSMRGRLLFLNADETLQSILIDGEPDSERFLRVVGGQIWRLSERYMVHAYGEMVGLLRSDGKHSAAVALERLWHELLAEIPFRLLCGYAI